MERKKAAAQRYAKAANSHINLPPQNTSRHSRLPERYTLSLEAALL